MDPRDVRIGVDIASGGSVRVRYEDRPLGVGLIGKTGTGKSSVLEHLILADLVHGTAGVVIDPHGLLAERVIRLAPPEALERIVLIEASRTAPFGLNLLACREPVDGDDEPDVWAAASVVQTFKKLYGQADTFLPRFERYLRLAARTLIPSERTLLDAPRLFYDAHFRAACLHRIANPVVQRTLRERWGAYEKLRAPEQAAQVEAVLNRLEGFLEPTAIQYMVGSRRTTIPFESVLAGDAFIIVSVPSEKLSEEQCNYIGSMVLCALADRVFLRRVSASPPRMHLYLDEYQRFETASTAKFLTEGRKYNVGVTLAHQTRGQMRDIGTSDAELQVRNLLVLPVSRNDADVLAGELPVTQREERIEWVLVPSGTEPVTAVAQDAVGHLSRQSHDDEVVRVAASHVIGGLLEAIDVLAGNVAMEHRDGRFLRPWDRPIIDDDARVDAVAVARYKRALSSVNELLVDSMEQRIEEGSNEYIRRLLDILDLVNRWLGGHKIFGSDTQFTKQVVREYMARRGEVEYWNGPEALEVGKRLRHEVVDAIPVPVEGVLGTPMARVARGIVGVAHSIALLTRRLAKIPILVRTGQERPVEREHPIVHSRQTEQDARNELAGRLVNPPKDYEYVAHVKLPRSYHEVRLDPPLEPISDDLVVDSVRRTSRDRYALKEDDLIMEDSFEDEPPSIGRRPPTR